MSKSNLLKPDFIVAIMAVIIGLCTMFVYIYQARIMSRQMHSSVWPRLQTNFSEGKEGIYIAVNNKGVGPAIVKSAYLVIDDIRYADSHANLDSAAYVITGKRGLLNGYTNIRERVISANEEIRFIEVTDSASVILLKKSLQNHKVRVEICYCSVYDECWTMLGAATNPCEKCDNQNSK